MDTVAHVLRSAVELLLAPLDVLPAWLGLLVLSVPTAVVMLVVVKRCSPQRLTERARDRMAAAIYEMRLFLDSPGRVVRAQGRLLGWMVVYLATLLPALFVLGLPVGLLYLHLEVRHGLAPLAAPTTIVLRVELAEGVDGHAVTIPSDDRIAVTAPLVVDDETQEVFARVRVAAPGTHEVRVQVGDEVVTKRVVADPDAGEVAPERRAGLARLWSLGDEPAPEGDSIRAISFAHPAAPQRFLGLPIPWWVYWLGASTVLALVLRRRFDVTF